MTKVLSFALVFTIAEGRNVSKTALRYSLKQELVIIRIKKIAQSATSEYWTPVEILIIKLQSRQALLLTIADDLISPFFRIFRQFNPFNHAIFR